MFKVLFCCYLIAIATASQYKDIKSNDEVEAIISVIDNIEEFQKSHDSVKLIPLDKLQVLNTDGVIRYTLGNRFAGDRLVATSGDSQYYSTPYDIKLSLGYPKSGTGAAVTFVEIHVDQSSNMGRGYVVAGGIGQRYISIVVEAYATTHFIYSANFYGLY